ncbi:hypothetical protein B0H19DRAFT_1274138 [Mycena capillaripes]|nr:hypothetical protein B0H19DRAFT_1274138 [Mycena capillaripes]
MEPSSPPSLENSHAYPRLPSELERTIFEIAALSCPTDIPILMRAARRIKQWVEPLLYRVVFLTHYPSDHFTAKGFQIVPLGIFLMKIATNPLGFQNAVESVYLLYDFTDIFTLRTILAACPRINNICAKSVMAPRHLPVLSQLESLRRLEVDLQRLFRPQAVDFTHPLFRNVTHLVVRDDCGFLPSDFGEALSHIPHLTHIAFSPISTSEELLMTLGTVLEMVRDHTRLECIVFFISSEDADIADDIWRYLEDSRVVCISLTNPPLNWARGATTGHDHWALAEGLITVKRAGRVDRTLYYVSDENSFPGN